MKFVTIPITLWFILAASALALVAAVTAEFGFHIAPCILCLAQRVPFALAIVISGAALLVSKFSRSAFYVLAFLFLINTGISAYQVGIEQKLWGLDEAGNSQVCTASNLSVQNIKDLYQSMSGTPVGDCAHPAFNFHGITFAVMDVVLSLVLLLVAAWQLRRVR
jgi:disulfide bond formation protein DsbB